MAINPNPPTALPDLYGSSTAAGKLGEQAGWIADKGAADTLISPTAAANPQVVLPRSRQTRASSPADRAASSGFQRQTSASANAAIAVESRSTMRKTAQQGQESGARERRCDRPTTVFETDVIWLCNAENRLLAPQLAPVARSCRLVRWRLRWPPGQGMRACPVSVGLVGWGWRPRSPSRLLFAESLHALPQRRLQRRW